MVLIPTYWVLTMNIFQIITICQLFWCDNTYIEYNVKNIFKNSLQSYKEKLKALIVSWTTWPTEKFKAIMFVRVSIIWHAVLLRNINIK